MDYDVIVIGGGYGGLVAASLLACRGYRVCLYEAHTSVGGCAGHFTRKNFLFDAGATTLSGMLPHQPLGRVFAEVGVMPDVRHESIGMMIAMRETVFARYADQSEWIESSASVFGIRRMAEYRQFWQSLYDIDALVWELTYNNYALPPASIREVGSLVKISNIKGLSLLPKIFTPIASHLQRYGLLENNDFVRFIDQQLLISTQNTHIDAPLATGAMGLVYPSETYYPTGGMIAPAQILAQAVQRHNGRVKLKHRVQSISRDSKGYVLRVQKGGARPETFDVSARCVISNATMWNMSVMTQHDDLLYQYFRKKSSAIGFAWGAFMLYCAIQTDDVLPTAYYQVHTNRAIPYCESDSFFITASHHDDRHKAPLGWRTLTISTHTPVENWLDCSDEEYSQRKQSVQDFIMAEVYRCFPAWASLPVEHILTATPKSFAFFTRRHHGFVGGVPHSVTRSLLRTAPNATPFRHLYMVGDTVFPGQGTPAVAMGAVNVAERVSRFL
jgi:C-3',4' desaturase CrtD